MSFAASALLLSGVGNRWFLVLLLRRGLAISEERFGDLGGSHALDDDLLLPAGRSRHQHHRLSGHLEAFCEKPNELYVGRAVDGRRLHANFDRVSVPADHFGFGSAWLNIEIDRGGSDQLEEHSIQGMSIPPKI